MASHDTSATTAAAEDIFDNNPDPFNETSDDTNGTTLQPAPTERDQDDSEGHRLVGVISDNPFARSNEHSGSRGGGYDVDSEAVEPRDRSHTNPIIEEPTESVEPEPASALSTGADNVDPRDTSLGGGSTGGTKDETAPLESLNSNVHHDRSEPGTDIYMAPQPPIEQPEGSSQHDSSKKSAEENPRVAFAGADKIDNASVPNDKGRNDDRRGSVRQGTMSNGYDFSGKLSLSRNNSVVARTFLAYPNPPPKDRPTPTTTWASVRTTLWKLITVYPYWDMAFWSGFMYTWGSVLFVICGTWSWGPVGWNVTWEIENTYINGVFFFVGALMYQIGATMAYLEAVNNGSFSGHAMKRFLDGHDEDRKAMLDASMAEFFHSHNPLHHRHRPEQEDEEKQMASLDPTEGWKSLNAPDQRKGSIAIRKPKTSRRGGVDLGEDESGIYEYTSWRWYPKWETLKTHHIQEIGYIACSIQLFGATLFSWCGLVSIPGVSSRWTSDATWYGGYWLPEVLGSCCFLSASFMFLSQTQQKWWKPEFGVLGWWVGFWAMIGSWGFLLNGIFGVVAQAQPDNPWAEYASECCTTWGSAGYLLSGFCQYWLCLRSLAPQIDDETEKVDSSQA